MGEDGFRYKDGQKFSVNWLVYNDSTWTQTISSMAADSWKQLGVELDIQLMDFDTVASRTTDPAPADKDFDIYTMGFSLSVDPDPTGALFDADAYVAGGFNASGYRNDRAQELIKQGAKEKNISVESSEIDDIVNKTKANYEDDEKWKAALEQAGFTEEKYRENVESQLLQKKLTESIASDEEPSQEDQLKYAQIYATPNDGSKRS